MKPNDREQAAFEKWLADKCPSGDVDAVQKQWEASSALRDFLGETEEIAELKEAYALLFKAHAAERARWEDSTSMDCASCEYVAPTRHEQCKGCERTVTIHTNYKRASWA